MSFNSWEILLPVAILALVGATVRLARRPKRKSLAAILGLSFLALCLLLNTRAVYEAVDPLLGGTNVAYLGVQLTFVCSMFFMKAALVPRLRSADGKVVQYRALDVTLFLTVVAAVSMLFIGTPTPISAYRAEPYRTLWQIVLATQLVNLYSLYVAVPIVRETYYRARSKAQRKNLRIGSALLCVGFAAGILTALARVATAVPYVTADIHVQAHLLSADGYFVSATVFFIAVGWSFIFIGSRRTEPRGYPDDATRQRIPGPDAPPAPPQ